MTDRNISTDVAGGLFQPDVLLPVQHARRTGVRRSQRGEYRLMMAILEDAVDVYLKHAGALSDIKRQLFEDAEAWVESDDKTYVFAFESICHTLEIDPDCVRDGLRAHKARARVGRASIVSFPAVDTSEPVLDRVAGGGARG
jgi:hypothetical protein